MNREMYIPNIKAVEWYSVRLCGGAFGGSLLTILLCFSKLRNNRDAEQFLSCQSDSLLDRLFVFELNITDTVISISIHLDNGRMEQTYPLER